MPRISLLRVRTFLAAAVLIAGAASPLIAQQTPASAASPATSDLVIKKTVRRVVLDVAVTDGNGKPVHGLTRRDFAVSEDGKPQQVLSFEAHSLGPASEPVAVPSLPPNTFINVPSTPERGPLYVILYDLVNMEVEDQARARQQVLKFINDKPAGTRFAVFVLSDALRLIQGFTEDRSQLFAALDPKKPKAHVPKIFLYARNYGRGDPVLMISVFTGIAHFLDGLPGRKNLIWMAGPFPVQIFPRDGDPPDLARDVHEAVDTMARAQLAVFPVDVRGVVVDNARAPEGAPSGSGGMYRDFRSGSQPTNSGGSGGATAASSGSTPPGSAPASGASVGVGYSLLFDDYAKQDEIASVTGGHAFYSNNDISAALAEATDGGAHYYTLSYSPANQNYDGNLRRVEVALSTHGYSLSYRRSYFADDPDSPASSDRGHARDSIPQASRGVGDSLFANMQHGAPLAHQLIFKAHVYALGVPARATPEQMANLAEQPAYFKARRKNRPTELPASIPLQTYGIDYTILVGPPKTGTPAGSATPSFEIAVAAFDDEGRMLNGVVENAVEISTANPFSSLQAAPPPSWEPSQKGFYRARQHIDVPLTATSIRLAVRNLTTDRVGAMEVALPLPLEPVAQAPAAPGVSSPAATAIPPKSN